MRTNPVRNNKGLSLIEAIVSLFISAIALVTLNMFATQMNIENKKLSDNSASARKNYNFLELMNNPTMWKATVLDVKNYSFFSCKLGLDPHPDLKAPVDCNTVDNKFRIVSSEGNTTIVYDQMEKDGGGQAVGFTAEGVKCFGFDAANGNDACPTHYEVSWDLQCLKNNTCREPMATVTVKQITKYLTKTTLDSEKTFNLNVNLPQSVEIAPRDSTYLVNINNAEISLDVLKSEYSTDLFNLKLTSVESSINSAISIKNNKISYVPKANFYGIDKVHYTVEQSLFDKVTKADGVIWVKVMTPYTWTGEGPVIQASMTGKKWYGLYNKLNWCGTVVDNKCTHFYPDANKSVDLISDNEMKQASLVFNDTCVNCNVLMNGEYYSGGGVPSININSMEIAASFAGEIKQVDNINIVVRRNAINRTANDPALEFAFWQRGGVFIGANSKANLMLSDVLAQNRSITIDRDVYAGNGPKAFTRGVLNFSTYKLFGIEGGRFYSPENVNIYAGFNLIDNKDMFFNQNGRFTVYPRWDSGNFLDAPGCQFNEFAYNGSGGYEYNLISNFTTKDLHIFQSGYEHQLRGWIGNKSGELNVTRNVYMHGAGGFMINGWSGWGYENIVMSGTDDQYIYSNLDFDGNKDRTKMGRLPLLTVDKPSGVLHIKGDLGFTTGIDVKQGRVQFYNEEEVAAGDQQMVEFSSAWNTMYIKNSSAYELVFPNLEFSPQCAYIRIDNNFRVAGDFIQDKRKYNPQCAGYPFGPRSARILVEGDVYAKSGTNEYDGNGIVTVVLSGTKNQKIIGFSDSMYKNNVSNLTAADLGGVDPEIQTTVAEPKGFLPDIEIDKAGGTVTMTGAIGFAGNFTITKGDVDATDATFSFVNTNGNGAARMNIKALNKSLKIKALNVQRALTLLDNTLQVTGGVNFPKPADSSNAGQADAGTLEILSGDLYYNSSFDKISANSFRARIKFLGTSKQTIFSTMAPDNSRYGSFDIIVDKKSGNIIGELELSCQNSTTAVFLARSLTLTNGNINLKNCGLKTSSRLEIQNGNYQVAEYDAASGTMVTRTYNNGNIFRGGTPGVLQYGSIVNNGTITPEVVAGQ